MKKFILPLLIVLVSLSALNAQPKKMNDELKKIRKQKYMDAVSVDEATADKYFKAVDENFESIMKLNRQKKENMDYVERNPDASDVVSKIEETLDIESKILEKKKEFYTVLKTFLTPKQLGQSLVFQIKFAKELKKQIDKKKRGHRKPDDR